MQDDIQVVLHTVMFRGTPCRCKTIFKSSCILSCFVGHPVDELLGLYNAVNFTACNMIIIFYIKFPNPYIFATQLCLNNLSFIYQWFTPSDCWLENLSLLGKTQFLYLGASFSWEMCFSAWHFYIWDKLVILHFTCVFL